MPHALSWILRVASLSLALLAPAWALDPPTGPVVLSVVGKVNAPNRTGKADFDIHMLEKLPQQSFSTKTPWYPAATKFSGPLLRDVLAAAKAQGTKMVATALNDYRTEIPFEDAMRQNVIVAILMNDKPMPVREKGPLFIIYPFDSKAELRSEMYYNRSAWQLRTLSVD